MTNRSPSHSRVVSLLVSVAVAMLLLSPTMSFNSKAEDIPHENYDLVKSNLDVIIALLRTSIAYSENALGKMYTESMVQVEENLTVVRGLLTPAERILERIRDIASSYENLSRLLPPFNDLSAQMDSFSSMEVSLLGARDDVVSASRLVNLTEEQMVSALDSIGRFKALIDQMNRTIDSMLVSADGIIGLVVEGNQPFTDNRLIPLIEQLRDLLYSIEVEIDRLVTEGGVPWDPSLPFSLLWLSAGDYYLGDQITGGGYLYFDGGFPVGHLVTIRMDGADLTSAITSSGGRFSFTYPIPLNASWLGTHVLQATSMTPTGPLNSDSITIRILLVPTTISLHVNSKLLRLEDQLHADVQVKDFRKRPLADASCYFLLDGQNLSFRTDTLGGYKTFWEASDLGYGVHTLQAFYVGELPYEPSSSDVTTVVIDIPTSVDLNLFETRYFHGYHVVGNGTLVANGTTPMPGQEITLSIDGIVVANLTTGPNGEFAFAVSTESMTMGTHTIVAAFLHHESIWRYSQDEQSFTVYGLKVVKYPFWPIIPKWSFGPGDTIPYLFIGQYAYFFWLLVLMGAAIAIRVIQIKDKRKRLQPGRTEVLESLEKGAEAMPATAAEIAGMAMELLMAADGPTNANERIVWYYQRLLAFLSAKANIAIRTSMTHWEVARILKILGFPVRPVDRATILFERALYSGALLSDDDAVMMSTALTDLVRVKPAEGSHAG
ncbi:MAG: DUF4129 domain-containing protein [Candidatus Thermoplasmatota archaeon]|nr:DUF4129 domain-containing protein [Candidatus Thermoplasmatota archaeon]